MILSAWQLQSFYNLIYPFCWMQKTQRDENKPGWGRAGWEQTARTSDSFEAAVNMEMSLCSCLLMFVPWNSRTASSLLDKLMSISALLALSPVKRTINEAARIHVYTNALTQLWAHLPVDLRPDLRLNFCSCSHPPQRVAFFMKCFIDFDYVNQESCCK